MNCDRSRRVAPGLGRGQARETEEGLWVKKTLSVLTGVLAS